MYSDFAMEFVLDCFAKIIDIANELFSYFGIPRIIISVFMIGVLVRYLLSPILDGGLGSDSVKVKNKEIK